jgi:putative acetyltransferase
MSCFQDYRIGFPERMAIIIIIIRTCLPFLQKMAVDALCKLRDVEEDISLKEEKGMSDIVIRHIEASDAEALRHINSHPGVYHDTLQIPHPSMAMWQERAAVKPGRRHLVACLDEEVVGHLALDIMENPRRGHVATFGIGVSAEKHGRGVGSALMREMVNLCDNWLRIERIELTVFVDNAPALTLYQKFGFEIEGTGKRFALRNGEYVDAYFMARIKQ